MQPSYLSPARYLAGGYGVDTTDLTTVQLRNKLVQATNMANRYCNVPKLPQAFDFRGGTMTDERHQFPAVDPLAFGPGARRVFLNAAPVKSVSSFILDLGLNNHITIDAATQLYVNTMENFVEIVAVNPVVVGWWPPYPIALYEPIARVTYTYGKTFTATGDELEAQSPNLFMASFGNWQEGGAVTVAIDGVEVDPADYTVNESDGTVAFASGSEPTVNTVVTADYTYTLDGSIADGVAEIATYLLGLRTTAQRGMLGIQSLRVAEVAISAFSPAQMVTKNGVSVPASAAQYLDGFVYGSVAA